MGPFIDLTDDAFDDDAFPYELDALPADAYSDAPAAIDLFDDELTWPAPDEIADYEAERARAKAAADRMRQERRRDA
jgi:hypothetical protein